MTTSPPVYRRSPLQIAKGLANSAHYRSLPRLTAYGKPVDALQRYVLGRGEYPAIVPVRAPGAHRPVDLRVRSRFDVLTVHEVFVWRCYPCSGHERVVVDLGSNVGISMAYFLASAPHARVVGVEPLAENVTQSAENLRQFKGRWEVRNAAVMDYQGEVELNVEPSGRYSGIGFVGGSPRNVPCVGIEDLIREVVAVSGPVDLLKVDIEGAEGLVLGRMTPSTLAMVNVIAVEGNAFPIAKLTSAGFTHNQHFSGVHWFKR